MSERIARVKNSLRGTLAGDSLGLVFEGLRPAKVERMTDNRLQQRFLFGRGVPSDDSAHAYLTALALNSSNGDPYAFERHLRGWIRKWFLALPYGIGLATLKSGLKMSILASKTSVNSAGNGPAMRASVIGAWFKDDPKQIAEFIRRSTELTHHHPLALGGSLMVAEMAAGLPPTIPPDWPATLGDPIKGPSGFIVHTVNTVRDIAERADGDATKAIELAIRRGGDTDTIAAIIGGVLGLEHIPPEAESVFGWPTWKDIDAFPRPPSYPRILAFHLSCYPIVIYHGFRRLL